MLDVHCLFDVAQVGRELRFSVHLFAFLETLAQGFDVYWIGVEELESFSLRQSHFLKLYYNSKNKLYKIHKLKVNTIGYQMLLKQKNTRNKMYLLALKNALINVFETLLQEKFLSLNSSRILLCLAFFQSLSYTLDPYFDISIHKYTFPLQNTLEIFRISSSNFWIRDPWRFHWMFFPSVIIVLFSILSVVILYKATIPKSFCSKFSNRFLVDWIKFFLNFYFSVLPWILICPLSEFLLEPLVICIKYWSNENNSSKEFLTILYAVIGLFFYR